MPFSKPLLFFFLVFCAVLTKAQQGTVSSGAVATGTGGTSSYSIGQTLQRYDEAANGSTSAGLQQPYEVLVVTEVEEDGIQLSMTAFPNPTSGHILLQLHNSDLQDLSYSLTDVYGKGVAQDRITETTTTLSLSSLSGSIYFLHVSRGDKKVKTFKLIKSN